jgi:hypothetical protein
MESLQNGNGNIFPLIDAPFTVLWKQVENYSNYWVSNTGVIWNQKLNHVLPGWIRGNYKAVGLIKDNQPRTFTIHSLVARAFIPNPLNKPVIDHIDNKLDNNVTNLRWATYKENGYNRGKPKANTSGYKGVSLHKPSGKWMVHLNRAHIGMYDTVEKGYEAYCTAARELHGEFFHP